MTGIRMITDDRFLIVVAGPTAVGKTACAISLALHFDAEIISADSRQFYREMTIGTAVPSQQDLSAVPHHFIRHLSVQDAYNVSRYETDALKTLENLFQRKQVVIMVGGSGLYIDAVCRGIDELPDPDPELRRELKQELADNGIQSLRDKLRIVDPDYYQMVDAANPVRLIRALEVCITTGKPFSSLRNQQPEKRPFRIIKIGLSVPRDLLNQRINQRVDEMVRNGLVEEARALIPFRRLNALNTVGYRELFDFFDGKISLQQAIADIKTHTRRYAKRQMTWFKKDEEITWFSPEEPSAILDYILESH